MKILQLAPLWLQIPPKGFGGTERVIHEINEGLAALGHEVTMLACKGSSCKGKTIEITDPMLESLGKFDFSAIQSYEFLSFNELLKIHKSFDVIHNHMGIHPLALSPAIDTPIVTTYHSSIEPDFPHLAEKFKDSSFVSISQSQRLLAPYLNWEATIPNPINIDYYQPKLEGNENSYLLFLGALNKRKGLDLAVRAAVELKENLIIAGNFMYEEDKVFFEKEIKPYIDDEKIKFVGEVNDVQKLELYRNAKGFLFPSQWQEAFGLVMVEAMACGTPVVGYRNGAVPEIIEEGRNGFVVDNFNDFVSRIKEITSISRADCRKTVEEKYSSKIVAQQYVDLYLRLIKS